MHRQLVGPGVQQGQHRQGADGGAGQQPADLRGLTAVEEPGDPVATLLQSGEDLLGGVVAVRLDERVVGPVRRRAVVERPGAGRGDHGVQDGGVLPVAEVHEHLAPAPARQPRAAGQVGARVADHVEELVPARHDLAAELARVGVGDAGAPGRWDGTYHPVILP